MTAGEVASASGLGRASVSTMLSKLASSGGAIKAARGYQLAGTPAEPTLPSPPRTSCRPGGSRNPPSGRLGSITTGRPSSSWVNIPHGLLVIDGVNTATIEEAPDGTAPARGDPIAKTDLQPGDLLDDTSDGHAILFVEAWEPDQVHFSYYSFGGGPHGTTPPEHVSHASFGNRTLSGWPTSHYAAYRYPLIQDDPPSLEGSSVSQASGDFNGDGRADLAIMYHHTDGSISTHTALAASNGDFTAFTGGYTIPAAAVWGLERLPSRLTGRYPDRRPQCRAAPHPRADPAPPHPEPSRRPSRRMASPPARPYAAAAAPA